MNDDKGLDPLKGLRDDTSNVEERYLVLSSKLRRYFEWKGFQNADDLSQETLKRGLQRLDRGVEIFAHDDAGFFLGIAKNIIREQWKTRHRETLSDHEDLASAESSHRGLNSIEARILLRECLDRIPREDRDLLLAYLNGKPAPANLSPNAFRIKIHRIRKNLASLLASSRAGEDPANH